MIKVTRGREMVFNPVAYETVKVFAIVSREYDNEEIRGDEDADEFNAVLTALLSDEIDAVSDVTSNTKSIVRDYRFTESKEGN